jgi:hypothetical protein
MVISQMHFFAFWETLCSVSSRSKCLLCGPSFTGVTMYQEAMHMSLYDMSTQFITDWNCL